MRLFIAEKPELARAIVEGLGGGDRKNGYYECALGDVVTWCFGHMLELLDPHEYDPKYKKWEISDLPIAFVPWKKKPSASSKEQLNIVTDLIRRASTVVNAGDPDAEGQLLVDEILQYAQYKGPVKRVLINDNTPAVVKKSLGNLRNNGDFAGLSAAAEARQVGDQFYGYTMSRLYTIAGRQVGGQDVLSVGRVQTPILGLVVRRDRENADHKKQNYFEIRGNFAISGVDFSATYKAGSNDPLDEKGRIIDKGFADGIVMAVSRKPATVMNAETAAKETPPPLPYNLLKLQTDAARLYGLKPDAVKDITQNLREKYRLITYNRSDCQYLSEEQHADAPGVLAAIAGSNPALAEFANVAKPSLKSRAYDSSKVTAHHAIIPTAATVDFSTLSKDEQNIYTLIARAYIAQFWEPYKYEQTTIGIISEGHEFACKTHVPTSAGWKTLYGKDSDAENESSDDETIQTSLKDLVAGNLGECTNAEILAKETKPQPLYNMASLLTDLTRVAKYVKDDSLRKLLLDKDKGKVGENGGIGTPATRDSIIALLFKRGFIEEKKSGKTATIVSTQAGRDLYDSLPDQARYPDMTAIWHGQQKDIETGTMDINTFIRGLVDYLGEEVERVKSEGINLTVELYPCPICGKAMNKRKGKKGVFWGCSGYPECQTTLPDDNGKPGERVESAESPDCPECGKPMRMRKGQKGTFFGCSGYPDCKKTIPAKDGKPVDSTPADVSEIHRCMECGKGLIRRPSKNRKGHWWGCSGFPECKQMYFDKDGKPNYAEKGKK